MNAGENRLLRGSQVLLAVGAVTFLAALATGLAERAWQAYLLNFLLWTGVAQCGVIFAAAYQVTRGQWGDALRRMGESLSFFLPVSLLLFLVMMLFGAPSIFPWAAHPVEGKQHWLNVPFVTLRDLAAFLLVFGLSAAYVYYSQRPALRAALAGGRVPRSRMAERWAAGPEDDARCAERTRVLAPVLLIAFGLSFSLIGFDLVMSLDPHWYSTLFGWYFFVGAFYSMLAFLAVAAAVLRKPWGLERHLTAGQSHDLGRLLFGFCLLTGGFFWAQWLVFWYGDLAEEITWVVRRYHEGPFVALAWLMPYGGFVLPLVILLSKALKRDRRRLMAVAIWIFLMMWLERYIWIVPSIWKGDGAPLAVELLISAGFLGGFCWGWLSYNRRLPVAALAALPAARHHH
ncbi:MAG: hypothetical protein AAB225_26170 [Acidobacteriota bacterium]